MNTEIHTGPKSRECMSVKCSIVNGISITTPSPKALETLWKSSSLLETSDLLHLWLHRRLGCLYKTNRISSQSTFQCGCERSIGLSPSWGTHSWWLLGEDNPAFFRGWCPVSWSYPSEWPHIHEWSQHYLDSVVGKEHESGREILRKDLEHGVAEGEYDQNSL